jgi:hypothetical protein
MFKNTELESYLNSSSTIDSSSLVVAEWNLNLPGNIKHIGNYRYRPAETASLPAADRSIYSVANNTFDSNDNGNYYTDATYSEVVVDGGFDDDGTPTIFKSRKQKEQMLYSLEDCLGRFRPRSGINKVRYFNQNYLHFSNSSMATRPRYYMGHRDDKFKYWTSYRLDAGVERGIGNQNINGAYYIDDAAPFVVYTDPVPANRIVVKMQTNVGSTNLGPFSSSSGSYADPFFGDVNKTVPQKWTIQYLSNNIWTDAAAFEAGSTRSDGSAIIGSDGYVELQYGLIVPEQYRDSFFLAAQLSSSSLLPTFGVSGQTYLVKNYKQSTGIYYIWSDSSDTFETFSPTFGWQLVEDEAVSGLTNLVTQLVNPLTYTSPLSGTSEYVELQNISGIRILADTMNKSDSTFDLIEMSPRLAADLTDITRSFSVNKTASDIGLTGLPVGQLLASVGTLDLFDTELAFSRINSKSIINNFLTQNLQVKMYDIVKDDSSYQYYVPLKTFYVDGMPETQITNRSISLPLRDLYFYLEQTSAPELMIPDTSLSYAISTIMDYVGISNYTIKRIEGQPEPVIPFFFVDSNQSLAQVLESIAVSTQSAMFFDEYNNFIVMTKEYLMATESQRPTDIVLSGSSDAQRQGAYKNLPISNSRSSIIDFALQENRVYNDGSIQYSPRYIQRGIMNTQAASKLDRDRPLGYQISELWEVSPENSVKSLNEVTDAQEAYSLGAFPINSDITEDEPSVVNGLIINNTIDMGEAISPLPRYNGYLYANGEIIRYDAVQYSVPGLTELQSTDGNVWITSVKEYQNYFSKIPFNGKMYGTGLVRIFSKPEYQTIDGNVRMKPGVISNNGRAQFGTTIAKHTAGLDRYWYDNANVKACEMKSSLIFGITSSSNLTAGLDGKTLVEGAAGVNAKVGVSTSRNGIIKNYLGTSFPKDVDVDRLLSTQTSTVQASALVMSGGNFASTQDPLNYVSYVHKPLNDSFKHFGTRVRIIGKSENNEEKFQTPFGSASYYNNVSGGSAGLACLINPTTNNGYYYEIIALDALDTKDLANNDSMFNVVFYKIMKDSDTGEAVPVVLYGGIANILVDDGNFTGQYRAVTEENPTVYDLAVEYEDIGSQRRFYLYLNGTLIKIVNDVSPLPVYNNMALFVRGSSKAMFENIYAVGSNYALNSALAVDLPSNTVFGSKEISLSDAFNKYSLSGIVQSTMLSGVSPAEDPKYNLYFDEFGTIMREAAYFDVKYDKAYPALYARLAPNFSSVKNYSVSGFMAGAYGAEFLVFNTTDTNIIIEKGSANILLIQGATFTQNSATELTVDDHFSDRGQFSDPIINDDNSIISPLVVQEEYNRIKTSRVRYGRSEFILDAPYIQSQDAASDMMEWIVSKVMKPRVSLGIKIFPNSTIQLGDIVQVDYKDLNNTDLVVGYDKRFVVYNIEYTRTPGGPDMTVYLSEVV